MNEIFFSDSQIKVFDKKTFEDMVFKANSEGYFSIYSIQVFFFI